MKGFQSILVRGMIWKLLFYISSFTLNLIIANKLGAEQSGVFFFLLTNLSVAGLVLSFGLESAINYFNAKKEFSTPYLLSFALSWCLMAFFILILGLSTIDLIGLSIGGDSVFITLYLIGSLLTGLLSSLYFSSNDSITPNLIPSAINILLIALLLTTFNDADPASTLWVKQIYFTSSIITGLWLLFHLIYSNKGLSFKLSIPYNKRVLVYSSQILFTNLFVNLLFKVDVWMVNYFCTDHELGNYIQATKFAQFVYLIPNLVSFTLFPVITQSIDTKEKIEIKLISLVNLYFYIGLFICSFILISGYWLFPELYGSTFNSMYSIFIFLVPGLLSMACSYPITPYFSSIDRNKVTINTAIYTILVLLVLDLLLIPSFSVQGAALAASLAYTFYFVALLHRFRQYWSFSFQSIFKLGSFYRAIRVFISNYS